MKVKYPNGIEMTVDSRSPNGVLFEGEKGRIFVDRGKITGKPISENWDKGQFEQADLVALYKGKPFEGHKANFFRCIREGGLPVSDVYSHVMTMNTCHLCSVSARLRRKLHWDPKTESIIGDPLAESLSSRKQREGFDIHRV